MQTDTVICISIFISHMHMELCHYSISHFHSYYYNLLSGVWDTMSSDLVAKFVLVNTCKIVDKSLQVGKQTIVFD